MVVGWLGGAGNVNTVPGILGVIRVHRIERKGGEKKKESRILTLLYTMGARSTPAAVVSCSSTASSVGWSEGITEGEPTS